MAGNAIFVHDPGGYSLAEPGSVVALSANAIEACHRAGVASCVLDDLTSRPDICRRPDAYLRWQLDWLKRLDAASQLNGVVQACANLIIPPVNSLVITSRMLAGAVEALAPEGITYVGRTGPVEFDGVPQRPPAVLAGAGGHATCCPAPPLDRGGTIAVICRTCS